MELVVPSFEFESEFAHFYDDFALLDLENSNYYQKGKSNFSEYVQALTDEANGVNLPEDYVPCSHFWLINADKAIIGAIRIRHNINNEFLKLEVGHIGYDIAPSYRSQGNGKLMLKLALLKAKELGMNEVLITADDDNFASRKVIEANGGQLENIVMGKVIANLLARYWIKIK